MTISLIVSGFIITAIVLYYELKIDRLFKSRNNNVHFYVARDKDSELWLYIGKPIRVDDTFESDGEGCCLTCDIEHDGLKYEDYYLN